MTADLPVLGFADRAAFEAWLAAEPGASPDAWVKLAKFVAMCAAHRTVHE